MPYPTGPNGAATDIEILAMSPAVMAERPFSGYGGRTYVGSHDWCEKALMLHGEINEETKAAGEAFTAATCEWVMGPKRNCFYTQKITRNVLDRFSA